MEEQSLPSEGRAGVTALVRDDFARRLGHEAAAPHLEALNQREQKGIETYGRSLQTFNGRVALVDAYEEIIDLAQYIRQEMEERGDLEKTLRILVNFINGHGQVSCPNCQTQIVLPKPAV